MSNNQHYDSYEKRLDTVLGSNAQDWTRIRRAKADFDQEYEHIPDIDERDFSLWLAHNYGIQLKLDGTFAVETIFEIVDNQKYTVFLLKYS